MQNCNLRPHSPRSQRSNDRDLTAQLVALEAKDGSDAADRDIRHRRLLVADLAKQILPPLGIGSLRTPSTRRARNIVLLKPRYLLSGKAKT